MAVADSVRRITEPQVLRAIAHPVRSRLLYELHARGAARAADLAVELGEPANSVSFHLRQLAKYGLIDAAPDRARDGRDRWWKPAAEGGISWSATDIESQPGGKAAMSVWRSAASAWTHQMIEAFFAEPGGADRDTIRTSTDVTMRLTKAEAQQCADEVGDTLERWSRHGRDREASGDAASRRTYLALAYLQPFPQDVSLG